MHDRIKPDTNVVVIKGFFSGNEGKVIKVDDDTCHVLLQKGFTLHTSIDSVKSIDVKVCARSSVG